MYNWNRRLGAAGVHLVLSLGIAALAAALVFGVWYRYPYRELSGGRDLFVLLMTVDVVLGPLMTLIVFNTAKPWRELRRDLALIGLVQLAGLAYGLWIVCVARPVHLVFEIDRFRVIHATDIPSDLMDKVPAGVEALPLTGPTLLAVRAFRSRPEEVDATMAALQGIALAARPDLWEPYSAARQNVLHAARPVERLRARFASRAPEIDRVLSGAGRQAATTAYLPLVGRKSFWTVFIDPATAEVVAFMPLDSF